MTALTLYGHAHSRANRCTWMLNELGVAYDHIPTNFQDGSTRTAEFKAINPNGRVPALVDGELVLFESLAINLHLARRFGGPLAPRTPAEEALATQWSMWVMSEVEKPLLLAAANLRFFAPDMREPGEVALAAAKLARPWGVLEQHLADRPYLLGDRFTVADLNVAGVMTLVITAGLDVAAWPRMEDWLHRCLDRPAATDWRGVDFAIPRPAGAQGTLAMFV